MSDPRREALFAKALTRALSPLQPLLDDTEVSEVLINGPQEIYAERNGQLSLCAQRFDSRQALEALATLLCEYMGAPSSQVGRGVDGHLPDGTRVHVVGPPVRREGVCLALRRARATPLRLDDLVKREMLPPSVARFLALSVRAGVNALISGGTGSGKTALLTALTSWIEPHERVLLLEDTAELRPLHPHVIRLVTQGPGADGEPPHGLRELLRGALRLRPDRMIVGEVRGPEALDLLQVMSTGHRGTLATLHARDPLTALHRLEGMAMTAGVALPLSVLREHCVDAVDLIVQVERTSAGKRRVSHVSEMQGIDASGAVALRDIYDAERDKTSPPRTVDLLGASVRCGAVVRRVLGECP